MKHDDFENDIKRKLDSRLENVDAANRQMLQAARRAALDSGMGQTAWPQFGMWHRMALASALVVVLALVILQPWQMAQEGFATLADMPPEDIEMLSTVDFEELEPIEFYFWLEQLDDQV